MTLHELRATLRENAPRLCRSYWDILAPELIPAFTRKEPVRTFNDPVWRSITLPAIPSTLLTLPLMQRLRYVRQLGVAHLLYPGAHHSRLEHSLGCAHAAGLMFDALSGSTTAKLSHPETMRELIVCAALLHDCGHVVFSHAGEKVIETFFMDELRAARRILGEWLPPTFAKPDLAGNRQEVALGSGAAELATLMFLLSEKFVDFMKNLTLTGITPEDSVKIMASFIVGRPSKELIIENRIMHVYLAHIVSGDMDADKLDYVARDAFYAGLPVAVDTPRLLDQLKAVHVDEHTPGACELGLEFSASGPSSYYLFGMAPAGISALELFVFARSHLFDRIYCHHKVNAAEILIEDLIGVWATAYSEACRDPDLFMKDVYSPVGDDGFLSMILYCPFHDTETSFKPQEDLVQGLNEKARQFIKRQLPHRALAISSNSLVNGHPGKKFFQGQLVEIFKEEGDSQRLCECLNDRLAKMGQPTEVSVCPAKPNPVKENPDIWLAGKARQTLRKVNTEFNVEQLANAYRDVKQTHWIFCPPEKCLDVAVAAACYFYEKYDIILGDQAFEKAKLSRAMVIEYLENTDIGDIKSTALAYTSRADQRTLHISEELAARMLPKFSFQDSDNMIQRLIGEINTLKVPHSYYDYINPAFTVLKYILEYAQCKWGAISFADEDDFQEDFVEFLKGKWEFFKIHEHEKKVIGRTDIVISLSGQDNFSLVIELKNTTGSLSTAFKNNAGQAAAYAADISTSPISFLFATFTDASCQTRLSDAVDIYTGTSELTKHIVICIGLMNAGGVPSTKGAHARAVPAPAESS